MFPFFLSHSTGKKSANVTFGRGKVFPQALHVAGFLPALYPYSTTESGHDPVQPDFPHLMTGRQATGAMRCTQQTSHDGVAEMANATETQAGGLDPDLSQNGYGLTCRSLYLAKLFLSCMRGHVATPAPESPASSWTHLLTRHRTRLHDPRTPATTSRTSAQTCNGLSTSAPVVQLSRQIQDSATDTNGPANGLSIASFSCVSFAHSLLWCITLYRITL